MDEDTREALLDAADALGFAANPLADLAENPNRDNEGKISEPSEPEPLEEMEAFAASLSSK